MFCGVSIEAERTCTNPAGSFFISGKGMPWQEARAHATHCPFLTTEACLPEMAAFCPALAFRQVRWSKRC
jgi:hypothetical protein